MASTNWILVLVVSNAVSKLVIVVQMNFFFFFSFFVRAIAVQMIPLTKTSFILIIKLIKLFPTPILHARAQTNKIYINIYIYALPLLVLSNSKFFFKKNTPLFFSLKGRSSPFLVSYKAVLFVLFLYFIVLLLI